uniref:CX domain-containing protein n=1 Tax=Panagrellus redivivus TaxID=6233 RepID=A0A7E4ZZG3_PANRE
MDVSIVLFLHCKDLCTTTKTAMEIAAQQESRGILYEGYTKAFKQCIFEDGDIMGRNERYEFRCDEDMECCGRACCIPGAATVPLWLVILFIILGLLALAALLALLAYLCSKRKKTPKIKKVFRPDLQSGYRTISHHDDDLNKDYSALDESAAAHANRGYDRDRAAELAAAERNALNTLNARRLRRRSDEDDEYYRSTGTYGAQAGAGGPGNAVGRFPVGNGGPPGGWHEYESHEEEFKEEIEYEQKFVPSPLVETLIEKPQPVKIVQHNEDEISRASVPEALELSPPPTQKAQHAFYRPFVPDVVDEHVIAPPDRAQVGVHDISEITTPQYPSYSTLERPKERKAEKMYTRPGFDNVPSY